MFGRIIHFTHLLAGLALVVGTFSTTYAQSAGALDPSFGVQGRQLVTISTNPLIAIHNNTTDIVVQPDGKVLMSGYAYFGVSPTSGDDFIVMRFNPNGTLDSSFGQGGIFKYDYQGGSDELYGIDLQADGRIVAVGQVQINPTQSNANTAFAVIRLAANGTFDQSFGTGGLVVTDFMASLDQATEVAIQPDGRILVSGWSTRSNTNNGQYDFAVARYNTNGTLDTSFGTGGAVFTDFVGFGDLAQTSVLQPDGKLVVAGWVYVNQTTGYDFGLVRYNPDGSLDSTFGVGGKVVTPIGNNLSELVRGMDLAPDGKLVVMGDFYNPPSGNIQGNSDVVVVRYNANGTVDTTFDGDGKFIYATTVGDRSESGGDVVVQPDGKVLLTGRSHLVTESVPNGSVSHTELFLLRLNVNGGLDSSFGSGGIVFTDFAIVSPEPFQQRTGDSGEAIALQSDGKIVVGGEAVHGNGDYRFVIARYLNNIEPLTLVRTPFDFDGDGRSDMSVYRDGAWHLMRSTSGYTVQQFGLASDRLVSADYDGDNKSDLAVYRDGTWYISRSTGGVSIQNFGLTSDIPQVGDYDGDGRADLAVFRPSDRTWYLQRSVAGFSAVQFGLSDDKPVAADYDGDGRTDLAVYRASDGVWHLLRSAAGYTSRQYGISTDRPVPADYDGDGKADLAIYRGGAWWILKSSTNVDSTVQFGLASDRPVAGDYDGDGKVDMAVYRDGTWHVMRSSSGYTASQFGLASDTPLPLR